MSPLKRVSWGLLGYAALGAAILGIVLPLLPTTPFLLVAAFAFARASPRLHAWLMSHRQFGPLIEAWQSHGAIPPRAKSIAIASMGGLLVLSLLLGVAPLLLAIQTGVLAAVALFILTRPDGPPPPA